MAIRDTIAAVFTDVAQAQNRHLMPLTDDLPLLNSGLDSLCLAIIVASLEEKLGTDPFSAPDDVDVPVTFGEFVALYENSVAVH